MRSAADKGIPEGVLGLNPKRGSLSGTRRSLVRTPLRPRPHRACTGTRGATGARAQFRAAAPPPMEQHPHEVTYGGQTRAWTEARVSVSHTGSRTDFAPPASIRRVRSGPNLHSGETHHCVRRPLCPRPQRVHDSAKVCSLVLFPGRLRPDPGVGTCMGSCRSDCRRSERASERAGAAPCLSIGILHA